jgi:succinate dehydrogenase/fumarate reductase cytochrome b subunit
VKNALPAALVVLTALITSALVHAGFGIWWLSQHLWNATAPGFDWPGALAVSGTATTVVLIAGLMIRRLAAGSTPPVETEQTPQAVPVRTDR